MRLLDSGDLLKKYSNLEDKMARHFGRRYSRHRSFVLFFLITAGPLADREILAAYPMSSFVEIYCSYTLIAPMPGSLLNNACIVR